MSAKASRKATRPTTKSHHGSKDAIADRQLSLGGAILHSPHTQQPSTFCLSINSSVISSSLSSSALTFTPIHNSHLVTYKHPLPRATSLPLLSILPTLLTMNFLTTLLLATAASAAPLEKAFNLVTSSAPTSSNNGLYVTTESTGPLNSNAVLSTKADAASFYFSNGTVHYEAPNGAPWAMALVSGSDYEDPVEISVDPTTGSKDFKVAANGILSVAQPSWGGWLGMFHSFPSSFVCVSLGIGNWKLTGI